MALAPRSVFHRLNDENPWQRAEGTIEQVVVTGYPPETAFQVDVGDGIIRDYTSLAEATPPTGAYNDAILADAPLAFFRGYDDTGGTKKWLDLSASASPAIGAVDAIYSATGGPTARLPECIDVANTVGHIWNAPNGGRFGGQSWTHEFWLYRTGGAVGGAWAGVIGTKGLRYMTGERAQIRVSDSKETAQYAGTTFWVADTWLYIATSFDATSGRALLKYRGLADAEFTTGMDENIGAGAGTQDAANDLTIGARSTGTGFDRPQKGLMSAYAFYDFPLSDAQMEAHFAAGVATE